MFRDLLEQSQDAMFERDFARPGIFVKKVRGERVYWYFREKGGGNRDIYVGPQTDDLLRRIAEHRRQRGDERARRTLVRMLQRSGLPSTPPAVGAVLEAFAREGVFRHRVCLVGTHAFALYGGLLGARIRNTSVATNDIDIAQFRDVSIAIAQDERIDLFPILKTVDDSYRSISKIFDEGKHVAFTSGAGNKVEVLSPRQGPDTDD
ncbi:MAG: GSU2403 family nucleotidyltransferase fold protein, partial [Tagaea sp.]